VTKVNSFLQSLTGSYLPLELKQTPRILIVQRYGSNVKSISNQLAALPFKYEILSASDGQDALSLLHRQTADLVIVDALLSGRIDGYELCRSLNTASANPRLAVIMLLAGHLSLERLKGMQAGADLLLHRPVIKEELVNAVLLLLGLRLSLTTMLKHSKVASIDKSTSHRMHSVGY
jgi:DNA-binding response OmpR family regulator